MADYCEIREARDGLYLIVIEEMPADKCVMYKHATYLHHYKSAELAHSDFDFALLTRVLSPNELRPGVSLWPLISSTTLIASATKQSTLIYTDRLQEMGWSFLSFCRKGYRDMARPESEWHEAPHQATGTTVKRQRILELLHEIEEMDEPVNPDYVLARVRDLYDLNSEDGE